MSNIDNQRYEFVGAPSSFWDTVLLHLYVRDSAKKAYSCYSVGDKEGFFDNLTILIQKPISAITAVGNTFLMCREILPAFKSVAIWIPSFTQALSGAGIFLSITQLFLETMGMQRVVSFQAQFIHSPPPETRDPGELKKWAEHTKKIAENMKRGFERLKEQKNGQGLEVNDIDKAIKDLDLIVQLSDVIVNHRDLESQGKAIIDTYINRLDASVQIKNLKLLKKYKEEAEGSEIVTEKLHRRLGIQFVENLSVEDLDGQIETLDNFLGLKKALAQSELAKASSQLELEEVQGQSNQLESNGLGLANAPSELESTRPALQETNKLIETMQIQFEKRKIAHSLGSIASLLMITGFVLSLLGMPHIGLPIMILGSFFGMVRFLFWISCSESEGWKAEPDKWVNSQIDLVKQIFSGIAEWITKHPPVEIVEREKPDNEYSGIAGLFFESKTA